MAKKRNKKTVTPTSAEAAQRMAARLPENVVAGIGIVAILQIFTTVLPIVLAGCMREETDDPTQVQARVTEAYEDDPERLRKRTSVAMRKEAKRDGKVITKEQSLAMADAAIAETIASDSAEVSAFCASHM